MDASPLSFPPAELLRRDKRRAGRDDRALGASEKIKNNGRDGVSREKTNVLTTIRQKMIKGVIFDYDGTLADTVFACMEALRRTLAPILGRSITDAEIRGYFGPTEDGIFTKYFPERAEELTASYLACYRELQRDVPHPFPGIVETIRFLKEKGVRVALATAKGRGSLDVSLEFHPIADLFERIEVGSPLGRAKADSIKKIMAELDLRSEETAYVGDTAKDVVSSRKAGVSPWAVAWASTVRRDELVAAKPDQIFETVPEFRAFLETTFDDARRL